MKNNKNYAPRFFIGLAAAAIFALALTLVCAAVLRALNGASELALSIINSVIRILAVGVSCFFYCEKNGLLRGTVIGVCTHLAIFVLFGALGAGFNITARFFMNAFICVLAGCFFGSVISNLKQAA